jgi:hypothetical protein
MRVGCGIPGISLSAIARRSAGSVRQLGSGTGQGVEFVLDFPVPLRPISP